MKKLFYSLFPNNQPDQTSVSLLFTCFFVGIAGAFTVPTMSLFISEEVGARPFLIGVFFMVMTVSGVLISQIIGWWSDQGIDRKRLILICNIMGVIGFVIFAFNRNYWVLLLTSAIFISTTSAAIPQVFALAREILDRHTRPSETFSALLRSQISLGWVIGPPIAFFIATGLGFTYLFLLAAFMFMVLCFVTYFTLPKIDPTPKNTHNEIDDSIWRDKNIILLAISFVFMYCANNMYLISIPLYIAKDIGLDSSVAGLMMGTAAFIEIPIMLLSGRYALRFGKKKMMSVSIVAGTLFYIGIIMNTSLVGFIGLQALNGIFVGVTSALGISLFQDLKPKKMGQVTTLYSNSIKTGGVLGGVLAGSIADYYSFHTVFFACTIMSIISFITILKVRDV
ncbi:MULTISPECIES: sugar efflux transporter [Vibrio]|uniref:MFS transporter n=1 Tax=Vibrio casei TaxID=673372 RepID=A0A368LNK5_9VIBR|nr:MULTISPECIES: sugar efflux transporter [Vibrio]RCS73474.1 MFS transporter [Vibrio casei]HBV76950.1 MFS transporter [Vibrio sp.]